MPHDLNPEWGHVDDWLDEPAKDYGEQEAKEWLAKFRLPHGYPGVTFEEMLDCDKERHAWLRSHRLFCFYQGQIYRVTGASRMGDVWLTSNYDQEVGYEKRVNIRQCSSWTREKPEEGTP